MKIEANGLQIEVEDTRGSGTPVLLVMGLGGQLIHWPAALVQSLVGAGYRVIRFDNRDSGLSTHFTQHGAPAIPWIALRAWLGAQPRAPYALGDMAADALGVLDALGVQRAHIVGLSMGAMIAQRVALAAPQRAISLSSVMGSSRARGLSRPQGHVLRLFMARPGAKDEAALMAFYTRFLRAISSRRFAPTDESLQAVFRATAARHPPNTAATMRQLAAILTDTGRAEQLAHIRTPTLVLHGADDPLVPLDGAQDTARRIPGARLAVVPDMAHDLAPAPHPEILRRALAHLLPFLQSVDAQAA
jgi:pimeloyl-ACP methyl ester carboxylesterase